MHALLEQADEALLHEIEPLVTLGLHHEQQHQELLLTDIEHVLSVNPLRPVAGDGSDEPISENRKANMPRAMWKGAVLAEAPDDQVQIVEGNTYFPPDAVHREHLRPSDTHTACVWKGTASYYDVVVDGEVNRDAAWYYPQPKDAAERIASHVAFWRGVTVEP